MQEQVELRGSAIECRINAEDPDRDFLPSPGRITVCQVPGGPGVRVDTHVYTGYEIPPYYDSLIGKLICYGKSRQEVIKTVKRALDEYTIEPIKTTIPFYKKVFSHPRFLQARFYTDFVDRMMEEERNK